MTEEREDTEAPETEETTELETAAPPEMDAEEARRVLQAQADERLRVCVEHVEHVLAQHGCGIATRLGWTEDGRAFAGWRVQLLD